MDISGPPILTLRGVFESFGAKPVLRGLDLDVRRGEILTILGASGCGKSVLLKLVIGLLAPDRGEIVFDGVHVETMSGHALTALRLPRSTATASVSSSSQLRDTVRVTSVIVTHDLALAFGVSDREGGWFGVVKSPSDRDLLAGLVAQADRAQWEDPLFRDELATWLRRPGDPRGDGIADTELGLPALAHVVAPFVVRTFDRGDGQAARDHELAEHSPGLAVLGTPGDTPVDWLHAGQALARVLLHATAEGVSASFLNRPVEVRGSRELVRGIVRRDGFAQAVLRVSYGYALPSTARREPEAVITPG